MKGNTLLASAVVLALGCSGAAWGQGAQECTQEATQLKLQIEGSNLADSDRARLEDSLSEAEHADVARCGQIVARVKRELGAGADAAPEDEYSSSATSDAPDTMGDSPADTTVTQPGMPDASGDMVAQGDSSTPAQPAMNDQGATSATAAGAAMSANAELALLSTEDVVNKPVQGMGGEKVGEIEAIVVNKATAGSSKPRGYAVIGYGGLFGIGESEVLMDLDRLQLTADGGLQVPAANEDDFDAYPKYEEEQFQAYNGELGALL